MAYHYYPKRPVKSFLDLEVYQKTLGLGVEIVKRVSKNTSEVARRDSCEVKSDISKNLTGIVLEIPVKVAAAHSLRFGDSPKAIQTLEETMLACNLAVVYLEEYRDICNVPRDRTPEGKLNIGTGAIETDFFEEQIKEYLRVRGKIMRLQRAWIKFMGPKKTP